MSTSIWQDAEVRLAVEAKRARKQWEAMVDKEADNTFAKELFTEKLQPTETIKVYSDPSPVQEYIAGVGDRFVGVLSGFLIVGVIFYILYLISSTYFYYLFEYPLETILFSFLFYVGAAFVSLIAYIFVGDSALPDNSQASRGCGRSSTFAPSVLNGLAKSCLSGGNPRGPRKRNNGNRGRCRSWGSR